MRRMHPLFASDLNGLELAGLEALSISAKVPIQNRGPRSPHFTLEARFSVPLSRCRCVGPKSGSQRPAAQGSCTDGQWDHVIGRRFAA